MQDYSKMKAIKPAFKVTKPSLKNVIITYPGEKYE